MKDVPVRLQSACSSNTDRNRTVQPMCSCDAVGTTASKLRTSCNFAVGLQTVCVSSKVVDQTIKLNNFLKIKISKKTARLRTGKPKDIIKGWSRPP